MSEFYVRSSKAKRSFERILLASIRKRQLEVPGQKMRKEELEMVNDHVLIRAKKDRNIW